MLNPSWRSPLSTLRLAALAAFGVLLLAVPPALAAKRHRGVSITVVSSRADLVSGGSPLVAISPSSDAHRFKVTVRGRNVTKQFAIRSGKRFEGLVKGLKLGNNVLRATLPNGAGAKITLVNHPSGGPLFSAPQVEPWVCQPGALDQKCDQAPTYEYMYMSTNPAKQGWQPYDPSNPPSDVANTTTDQGVTVPFIIRVETGYMTRDQYKSATL